MIHSAKLPQTETVLSLLEPEELQTTGIKVILTTSTVYVPVFSMKCGRGQGAGGRWWWLRASSDWMQRGTVWNPLLPAKRRILQTCLWKPGKFPSGVRSYFLLQNDLIVIFTNNL